jgi:hypothetical protein
MMQFNPQTKELFDEEGRLIKRLECQYNKQWNEFGLLVGTKNRLCHQCDSEIMETVYETSDSLRSHLKNYPHACIHIFVGQKNIRLTHHVG